MRMPDAYDLQSLGARARVRGEKILGIELVAIVRPLGVQVARREDAPHLHPPPVLTADQQSAGFPGIFVPYELFQLRPDG